MAGAWAADRTQADAYLANIPSLIKSEDYKTIEDLCKRALQVDESCPSAHYHLGLCHEKNSKAREAVKEYQLAASLATKEKDMALAGKANAAAKRLGQGLIELDTLDQRLADRMHKLGDEALDAGQLDTASQAYTALTVLQPDNAKAKEALDKVTAAIAARGDPVKSKLASAMLAEMWYKLGTGSKPEAATLAKSLSEKYSDTEYGKEAAGLLERDFAAPQKDEVAQLSKKLKESAKKVAKPAPPPPKTTSSTPPTPPPANVADTGPKTGVDVEALEKAADEETKKMAKDALVPAFKDAHAKGKGFYAKATPGSEGNQLNVAKALEQFIRADVLYVRIEDEKLNNGDLAEKAKEASMLRYACMKMTILSH